MIPQWSLVCARRLTGAVCIAVLVVVVGTAGTDLTSTSEAKTPKRSAGSSLASLAPATATGAFGLDLMRTQGHGNLILSPDSVATALAMTGTGAVGSTAAEIAQTLHLKGPAAFPAVGNLQRGIVARQAIAAAGDPKPPALDIADGLFLRQGLSLEPAFLSGALQHFGAAPEAVDFAGDPTGTLDTINGWVSERTGGLIPQIPRFAPPGNGAGAGQRRLSRRRLGAPLRAGSDEAWLIS